MRPPDAWRRRAVLGAALGFATLGVAGCDLFDRSPDPPPPPDPLEPLRAQALVLADRYALVIAAAPALAARLGPLRDAHLAHVTALNKLIGTPMASTGPSGVAPPPGSASPDPDPATAVTALRAAEEAAQRDAVIACLAAPFDRAGLVGSIAACRATHAAVLT